jgi:hypothetical protein
MDCFDMTPADDPAALVPASLDDLMDGLVHGLRYDGCRRVHDADEMMARIVAERLIEHLGSCGFVLMRKPGRPLPDTSRHRHPNAE